LKLEKLTKIYEEKGLSKIYQNFIKGELSKILDYMGKYHMYHIPSQILSHHMSFRKISQKATNSEEKNQQ
jgi:hypothetical protein